MKRGVVAFTVALGVILVIATVVSQFASSEPDGLEFVAEQQGFADAADDSLGEVPLADYGGGEGRSLAVAGLVGVAATLGLGFGVFWLVRAGKHDPGEPAGT